MRDILFDEKISGSFHFTLVRLTKRLIMAIDLRSIGIWSFNALTGGGSMFFDGELIRQDGLFVPEDLHPLNPEYLLGKD